MRQQDPLMSGLLKRVLRVAATLTAGGALALWLAALTFGWLLGGPPPQQPADSDPLLSEARSAIAEVVAFSASAPVGPPAPEPGVASSPGTAPGPGPGEAYPASIDVSPVIPLDNPFLMPPAPVAPAPEQDLDLETFIRAQSSEVPISVRGIAGDARTNVAVLVAGETVRTVRPGDSFLEWRVLAIGRDRVLLGRDGLTRTVAWEGSK